MQKTFERIKIPRNTIFLQQYYIFIESIAVIIKGISADYSVDGSVVAVFIFD